MRILLVALLSLLASSANAYKTGLMGYGQSCAPLDCPSVAYGSIGTSEHSHGGSPLAPCIATNSDFLHTLAYCLSTRCADVSPSELESYWAGQATGDKTVSAEWTYGSALANYDFNVFFDWEESVQSTYVIILISIGVATPVFFSALGYLPFMNRPIDKIRPYLIYPSTFRGYNIRPLPYLLAELLAYITDWPFSTSLVLHRWVARLCALHAILHSITLLAAYIRLGTYYTDLHKPYWIWGIVGTLCLVLLLVQSVLWFHRASYEVFLIPHIVLAVFVIFGCWYHIYFWKPFSEVYELWIYMVCAVWFFDWLFRVLRVAKNGVRRASVVELSDEIVRLDISGVRWLSTPGYHAYIYFPTLQPFRLWQNHPFSITNTALLQEAFAAESSHSGDV
ncbi:FAD-binding 8 [Fusarium oxysporum f. sp. vasinfectum]|nr:FAD-binding 8 [Fusarium oxysporum f. sp. vasinfectum]